MTVTLHHADMREALKAIPDNSIDSCVTDPPYHLTSVVKRFGGPNAAPAQFGTDGAFARASRGFMNTLWDGGDIAFQVDTWREVYRVLKPGAYIAAFGAPKNFGRMQVAILDAGFEERDTILNLVDPNDALVGFIESLSETQLDAFMRCMTQSEMSGFLAWLYGTGFPKSHDVSKGIDKMDAVQARLVRQFKFTEWMRSTGLTASQIDKITNTAMGSHYTTHPTQPRMATRDLFEMLRPHFKCDVPQWVEAMVDERTVESENFKRREVLETKTYKRGDEGTWTEHTTNDGSLYAAGEKEHVTSAAHTDAAREWEGWGTALKPAFEPIVLARKPLSEGTVAANVLRWRTGGLNIGACRINPGEHVSGGGNGKANHGGQFAGEYRGERPLVEAHSLGRWPANVVHDGSDEVVGAFPQQKPSKPGSGGNFGGNEIYGDFTAGDDNKPKIRGHSDNGGSAARFFYSAKASKADRAGSKHPTVKPISLMEWLATLITPPGGTVLDPFAGSGTTGAACRNKGFNCILIEREDEYVADIRRRLDLPGAVPLDAAIARYLRQKRALAGLTA